MSKAKVALLGVVAACVVIPIVVQQSQIRQLTTANQELGNQLEQSRRERDELEAANARLQAAGTNERKAISELVRLRGDIARLLRELAAATNQAARTPASRTTESPPTDVRQTDSATFTGFVHTSLAPGQTLVMGGWPMEPGKRTLALLTPDTTVAGQQGTVVIGGVFLQVPEEVLSGPGWEQFQAVTKEASGSGVLDAEEAKEFVEALQTMEGVKVLASPRLTTTSGTAGTLSIGDQQGAGLTITLLPVVAADGQGMELTVSNSLRRLP